MTVSILTNIADTCAAIGGGALAILLFLSFARSYGRMIRSYRRIVWQWQR